MRRLLDKYVEDCRTFPADAVLAYRLHGIPGLWDTFAQRTLYRIVAGGHMVIFAQDLNAPGVPAPPGVVIRPVTNEDWTPFSSIVSQRDLRRFQRMAAAGHHCLGAWRGAEPIGYGWVAQRLDPDVTVCPLELPAHAAYLWDLYVIPRERSNGVGSALASARMQLARECGFSEGWRMIAPSNAPSLRTLAKTGIRTRRVGDLRFLKIFARMHSRMTPAQLPREVM